MQNELPVKADLSAKSPAPLTLTTPDPCFDPQEPLTVNGFPFVPASLPVSTRIRRRIELARSLADDLAAEGQPRMAQVIRDLCNSAQSSVTVNSTLHAELEKMRAKQ